jgi:4-amino-4-deoxy-L-arabinose transferase-like glycosyltransferase
MLDDVPSSGSSGCLRDQRFVAIAAGIAILACSLRVYRIGAQELWLDESYSFLLATTPEWFGPATLSNNSPPLYHFLLRVWMCVVGDSESAIRLLSAFFGTICVIAVIWCGRVIFSPTVGLWSGGFAAVSPFHIFYSQEARGYALLSAALMVTYALMARAIRQNSRFSWVLVSISTAVALYSHNLAIIGLIPTVLLVWAEGSNQQSRSPGGSYAGAMAAAFLLYFPWLLATSLLARHGAENPFTPYLENDWRNTPASLAIPKSLEVLGLGAQAGLIPVLVKQFQYIQLSPAVHLLGLSVLALIGIVAAAPWMEQAMAIPLLWKRKIWLWSSLFFPLAALWLISQFISPIYIVGRYDSIAWPAYTLLIGLACAKIQQLPKGGQLLGLAVILTLALTIGMKLVLYYQAPASPAGHMIAEYLDGSVANDDVVIFSGGQWFPVLYYLEQRGYEWNEGNCKHRTAARRFSCRLLPTEVERTLSFPAIDMTSALQGLQTDLERINAPLSTSSGTIWFGINAAQVGQEAVAFNRLDAWLVQALVQQGFQPAKASNGIGNLYTFRRPTSTVSPEAEETERRN